MSRQKRKYQPTYCPAQSQSDDANIEEGTCSELEGLPQDSQHIDNSSLNDDEECVDSPKVSKRMRFDSSSSEDSSSSMDSHTPSISSIPDSGSSMDSHTPSISSTFIPDNGTSMDSHTPSISSIPDSGSSMDSHTPSISSIPEVIDLSLTPLHKGTGDVVDLTAEPNSPTFTNDVVDLTKETVHHVDLVDSSPVIVRVNKIFERSQLRPLCGLASTALVSDNDEQICEVDNQLSANVIGEGKTNERQDDHKNIICPICFDDANMLKRRKRRLTSTFCGHVFCDRCIKSALKTQNKCPTCRKKLTLRQIHPLFI